jgi:tyrosinase
MGRLIWFLCVLCVLAVIPSAHLHLACAHASNEGQPPKCSKLLTRKEWRTLTLSEKAGWVGAVKVRALFYTVGNVVHYIAYAE